MDYIKWMRSKVGPELIFLNFAGAIVTNDNGELLLQRRRDRDAWGFPGGAMELGESAEQTAIREVREETGYEIAIDSLIGAYTKYFDEYPNGDRAQTIVFCFRGRAISGQAIANNDESIEVRWFNKAELPPLFNQQHQDALEDYLNNRVGHYR